MIYPAFGISILTHMAIVGSAKIKKKLNLGKAGGFAPKRLSLFKKTILALFISVIIEFIFVSALAGAAIIIYLSSISDKSNFAFLKKFLLDPIFESFQRSGI